MSLADELLADLEDLDDEANDDSKLDTVEEGEEGEPEAMQVDAPAEADDDEKLHDIAKLQSSEDLTSVLDGINKFNENPEARTEVMGPVEESPEYQLVVKANNLTLEVDNELAVIHKFVRDKYAKRFPELEQLVLHPVDYIRTVKMMQNQMDCNQLDLTETLPPATIMIVSVVASSTQGKPLDDAELKQVLEGCDMALDLCEAKNKIFDYVESRMFFLAPNLAHICGANTAAKLLGIAGGLTALSKMPACNILVLGASKKSLAGFSAMAMLPHTGFIYYCDIVQKQPHEYRKKAARLVAAKCALAARVDSYYDERAKGATVGIGFREDIVKKLAKAQEPPPAKLQKALPAPDMNTTKKRGGKRVRKMKDRYTMSETRKAANRVGFGELEEDVFQDEMGFSLGQLGKNGTSAGHFRAPDAKKGKAGTLSKKMKKRLEQQKQRTGGLASSIRGDFASSGTASVAFTPVQGLEINRVKSKKDQPADPNDKYFSTSSFAGLKKT